ncbi:acyl carrier protein [Streptomyces sp. TRM66268-LWL]|uniref:Acyl carrier protein n=2 Tax=Streptomyces polyasparticus TaxID=2767826 RepID=A0ABR7SKH5_9ACTN|nr:acyl carrier protein [Streptomyces polyasparticus]
MTRTTAYEIVQDAIREIVPDADFSAVGPDDKYREALEIDSLDFESLVELLAERTGLRIDEDDYPRLTTLGDAADFLAERQS